MARRNKNKWAGIVFGPLLVFFSLSALWKNEVRFDYHRAAEATGQVASLATAVPGHLISFTGPMDQRLTMHGEYVESFTGYLSVRRRAEIYAWDHDKDDDGDRWSKEWMTTLESNSRNESLRQELNSAQFLPPQYDVGDLQVTPDLIEFVDPSREIQPSHLRVTHPELRAEGDYLYWRKGSSDELGDERVRYSGVPVPGTATYFGKFESGRGTADTTHRRTGMINSIIQDTGILHHIVAGDRNEALATMKAHIGRLKWIVRAVGSLCVVLGFMFFFSTILGLLFHLPFIGRLAQGGAWILSFLLGLPLAFIVIASGYLVANPLIPALVAAAVVALGVVLRRRGKASQKGALNSLGDRYGHVPNPEEMKELEFIELARLALGDSNLDDSEHKFLRDWSRKQGWDDEKFNALIARSQTAQGPEAISHDDHLANLIHLALADGQLTRHEIGSIRRVATGLGYDDSAVRAKIQQARKAAMAAA